MFDIVTLGLALFFVGQFMLVFLWTKEMLTDYSRQALGLFFGGLIGFAVLIWPVAEWLRVEATEEASIRRYSYALLIGPPVAMLTTAIPEWVVADSGEGFAQFCLFEVPAVVFAVGGYFSARSFANEVSMSEKEEGGFTALPSSSLQDF